MKARTPYYLSELSALAFIERGGRALDHGFINQVFSGADLRSRASGYVSAAFKFEEEPLIEAGTFTFKSFLTDYCPRSEAYLIREVGLIYVRQINEAARLVSQRTPPVMVNIMTMQADIDDMARRRIDTLLLRKRQPELVSAAEMLEDFRSLCKIFR